MTGTAVDDSWTPLTDLARPGVWEPLSGRVSARLGGVERRVADSLLLLGLAARLWHVALVPPAAGEALLDPRCLLATDDAGALRLGVREPAGWSGASPLGAAGVVVGALEPLVAAVRLPAALSWGNVASALLGLRSVVPATAGWVVQALAHDRLVGTLAPSGRRRSCCLFYRAGGGLCADCCLSRVPVSAG